MVMIIDIFTDYRLWCWCNG